MPKADVNDHTDEKLSEEGRGWISWTCLACHNVQSRKVDAETAVCLACDTGEMVASVAIESFVTYRQEPAS